jgi:hypothetical protein
MASTYLQRTISSAGSNTISTLSVWVKLGNLGTARNIYSVSSGSTSVKVWFNTSNQLVLNAYEGSSTLNKITNRVFRDTSSFYHILVRYDTTDGTAEDRVQLYVNGTRETSFGTNTNPSASLDINLNENAFNQRVGADQVPGDYFDGSMAHFHWIDGTAYDASTFGETDSTTGEWKPKTGPSVTYGTNGFFLKFENASSFGEDSSGNNNDFTSNGSPTQLVDTPANILCTMNPLINNGFTYENGNLSIAGGADNHFAWGTLPGRMNNASAGWYFEMKVDSGGTIGASGRGMRMGIGSFDFAMSDGLGTDGGWALSSDTGKLIQNNKTEGYQLADNGGGNLVNLGVTPAVGDIISVAWKNSKVYIGINGTYYAADGGSDGDPANELNPSHTISSTYQSDAWMPVIGASLANGADGCDFNFGNGYFGTTAVTSGNQDDAGYGTFEYDVPTGYYTLNTKNINTYG